MDKHISAISIILLHFLKENGGYSNGFETYIKGAVTKNSYSRLKWNTPTQERLTGIEVSRKGYEVHNSVKEYLKDNNIESRLIISSQHIEDGCYETRLYFDVPTHKLDLYGL